MKSLCKFCEKFGKCGFGSYAPIQMLACPSYVRGKEKHDTDVFMLVESTRGRAVQPIAVDGAVSDKTYNQEITEKEILNRIKEILKTFPREFRASELRDEYEKRYGEIIRYSKPLRENTCEPWKYGLLINKCK